MAPGFRFHDDPDALLAAIGSFGPGDDVPLLTPADGRRRARWNAVLEGLARRASGGPSSGSPPASPLRPVVFVVDARLRPAADLLARIHHADVVAAESAAGLANEPRFRTADVPMVVALPDQLSATVVGALGEASEGRLTLVTALDVAGVHFVVAKAALWRQRPPGAERVFSIDELHSEIVDGEAKAEPFSAEKVERLLASEDVDAMVLHAHGEGSHAYLRQLALCGVLEPEEHVVGEAIPGGCRLDPFCKRATAIGVPVRHFSALDVASVWLLSCHGLSLARQGYPSRSSAVLALLEGGAVDVFCNDRSTPFSRDDVALFRSFAEDGVCMAVAEREVNAIYRHAQGVRPYLVVGASLSGTHTLEGARRTSRAVPRGARVVACVTEGASASDDVPAFRKADGVLVLAKRPWAGSVVDRTEELERAMATLEDLRARARLQGAIEVELRRIYGQHAAEALARVRAKRQSLEDTLNTCLGEVGRAKRRGVVGSRIERLMSVARTATARWDEAFVDCSTSKLFEGSLERACFAEVRDVAASRDSGPCERCFAPLLRHAITHVGGAESVVVECPICGPLSCWTEGGIRVTVRASPKIRRGEPMTVRVDRAAEGTAAKLVIDVRDKIKKVVVATHRETWESGSFVLPITWPEETVPDLQTIRVLAVEGMSWSFVRQRVAVT
jgi:hypothetical protein